MDPGIDSEWLGYKNDNIEEVPNQGNVARSWQWRERGVEPPNYPSNRKVLEHAAEDILVQKPLKIRCCDLPGYPRSTFLMVFSPDGTKVASTHGNHNIYVSELASGKHVRILKGHPRTPWCIAFHPSHPQLIGSGCLGGQVRVWDISSGGSEVWNVRNETVIASIAFHPREQLLVIATYNELYFWDWNQSAPFTKVTTNNVNEKVRYVAFDALGYKLITGISLCANPNSANATMVQQNTPNPSNIVNTTRRDDSADDNNSASRPQDNSGSAQEMIVNSYQNLVQRYDSLVRNYQRLYMVRHRLTNTPPPPPNTIDRGTDPMETDSTPAGVTRTARPTTSNGQQNDGNAENPVPSTSRSQDGASNSDGGGNSSRLFNLDVLSLGSTSNRDQVAPRVEQTIFGSRASAFQPLNDYTERSFRTVDQNERLTRLLPNLFSSTNNTDRSARRDLHPTENPSNSSRTSIFTSTRPEILLNTDNFQRRSHRSSTSLASLRREIPITLEPLTPITGWPPPSRSNTSSSSCQRPRMTNSSTQMSPISAPAEARTINESLDLIRDILRDSGTRLLNLITNMSIATLANMERNNPQRGVDDPAHTNDINEIRSRVRLFAAQVPRDLHLSSTSDSDSDQSLELNILRTSNPNLRENENRDSITPPITNNDRPPHATTDRMTFELNENIANEPGTNGINVSASSSRFHVRTQRNAASEGPTTSRKGRSETTDNRNQSSTFRHNVSSTGRDTSRTRGNSVPPREIYKKVKAAVNALQRHTLILTNLWLHGHRTTMVQLRNMWDNLRRRVLMLQRQTGHQDIPSQYTRSLLERCMLLTQVSENLRGSNRNTGRQRTENIEIDNRNQNPRETNQNEQNSTTQTDRNAGQSPSMRSSQRRSSPSTRSSQQTHFRRRIQSTHRCPVEEELRRRAISSMRSSVEDEVPRRAHSTHRWTVEDELRRRINSTHRLTVEDELRRRIRNPVINRLTQRYANRPSRDFARALEISATRHEIRMRAMQVLSVMFNMMMMCLEERGLSHVIINMLRTLKKALALTCLMLMSNRNNTRTDNSVSQQTSRMEALNVVRIEHIDHAGPINVDEPDESPHSITSGSEEEPLRNVYVVTQVPSQRSTTTQSEHTTASQTTDDPIQGYPSQFTSINDNSHISSQRWSNRLAVQIAAANRNNSVTANNRRKIYLERKRQKALHRTNPIAHPLLKKRLLPPVSNHRIPVLRSMPRLPVTPKVSYPPNELLNSEPVAGPSSLAPGAEATNQDSQRSDLPNDLEQRVNLIRLAHLQAVRMRNNAARYRRFETIRLYTPSSVREMFGLQSNNPENRSRNQPPQQNASDGNSRPYLPPVFTFRAESNEVPIDEPNQFHTVSNNAPMPLVEINELPVTFEPSPTQQRLPRIHEYLQPIILAQNAMVVEEELNVGNGGGGGGGNGNGGGDIGGRFLSARRMGGMAGLLDAGIISEAMPAPSHRVQAWDFTSGATPEIGDNTKNIVVQRCRIHNDASIDISKDGRLLVALLPVPRLRNTNHWLGVYSLEWSRLGHCLHTAVLEQSAVSVALSPTARHLAVGLGSRRFTTTPHSRNNVFALLYRLEPLENTSRTGLSPIKELEQNWEHGFTSLNCLRWAPQPGQGLVYANNTGQLIIMS